MYHIQLIANPSFFKLLVKILGQIYLSGSIAIVLTSSCGNINVVKTLSYLSFVVVAESNKTGASDNLLLITDRAKVISHVTMSHLYSSYSSPNSSNMGPAHWGLKK